MRKILLFLLPCLLFSLCGFSQGIDFQKKSYAELLKQAKKEKKLLFVDIYTSWCGPCRHMAKNIFPQAKVGDFYNAHFINLQLDAEKSEDGRKVAAEFMVTGYPTFLFIDAQGKLVYRFMGGRTVEQMVVEGQKAIDAFAALPQLSKYEKAYPKKRGDRKFLDEFFTLKDKAGLDCSSLLLDYFALVDDSELFNEVNLPRISKVSQYDAAFANRVVEAAIKFADEHKNDKKLRVAVTKETAKFLSGCLKGASKHGSAEEFEAVLALKKHLFEKTGLKDSTTNASLGGGNIYVPSNLLRLDFYAGRKMMTEFVRVYEQNMKELQDKYEAEAKGRAEMEESINKQLEAARKSGNQEEYQQVKRMKGLLFAFSGIDNYYTSTNMINHLDNYEKGFQGSRDEAYAARKAGWLVFLHRMSPSAKVAVIVADKLLDMNRRDLAIEVLEMGIKDGAEGVDVSKEDVKACQEKLDGLKK